MKNSPDLWRECFPRPKDSDHKYSRGQVAVLGGVEMTGAACLAAHAASRIGAGLVMIIHPSHDFPTKENSPYIGYVYRAFMPHLIIKEGMGFLDYLKRAEIKGLCIPVIGPGLGGDHHEVICKIVQDSLRRASPAVLDADALNAFEGDQQALFDELHPHSILTPHEGEFGRLFPDLKETLKNSRLKAAEEACSRISGVLILKGAQTIIAAKGRETIINGTSTPYLATAGSGDVLSGLIAGLLAQGMPAFDAACAAVWLHGRAGQMFGAGLIACDLPDLIPKALQEVLGFQKKVS